MIPLSKKVYGVRLVSLDELLATADYISLHLPKTKESANMIGAEQFAKMKTGVRIINCARGGIINEDALYDALTSGKVAGAALDVFRRRTAHRLETAQARQRHRLAAHRGRHQRSPDARRRRSGRHRDQVCESRHRVAGTRVTRDRSTSNA